MNEDDRILLFGGTTEGRKMAGILSRKGFSVTVCVATQTGAEYLKGIPSLRILTGRKDASQMVYIMREGYTCCIDATHPYAVEASRCIREACDEAHLPYCRYLRPEVSRAELEKKVAGLMREYQNEQIAKRVPGYQKAQAAGQMQFCWNAQSAISPGRVAQGNRQFTVRITECDSALDACRLLSELSEKELSEPEQSERELSEPEQSEREINEPELSAREQRALLTTGSKEAACFAPLPGMFVRVLPSEESIRLCRDAGFAEDHIITGSGPFTVEDNVRIIEELRIGTIVTKDGGIEGGYPQKLAAAALCGAQVIVIRRPVENGMTQDEIIDFVLRNK